MTASPLPRLVAAPAPFQATLTPLRTVALQDPTLADCPPFLRAASGLCWADGRLMAVQDDALFAAALTPEGEATVVALSDVMPRVFDASKGGKKHKADLECAFSLDDASAVAMGSGSAPNRQRAFRVRAEGRGWTVAPLDVSALFQQLGALPALAGETLNVEAAGFDRRGFWMIHRANGVRRDGTPQANVAALFDAHQARTFLMGAGPVPPVMEAITLDLGAVDGVPLGVTDLAVDGQGRTWLLCCAEATLNAHDDGKVAGAAVVLWSHSGGLWKAPLAAPDGSPVAAKCEGLCFQPGSVTEAFAVDDPDDEAIPSRLWRLVLAGA